MSGALFSQTTTAAGLLFISGQVPVDVAGTFVGGDITRQANAVFDRLADHLAERGLSLNDLVKISYFLTDISMLQDFRSVILTRLAQPRPASTLVEVSALINPDYLVEIEAIADAGLR